MMPLQVSTEVEDLLGSMGSRTNGLQKLDDVRIWILDAVRRGCVESSMDAGHRCGSTRRTSGSVGCGRLAQARVGLLWVVLVVWLDELARALGQRVPHTEHLCCQCSCLGIAERQAHQQACGGPPDPVGGFFQSLHF
mgnify:CR=1 FL=1